MSRRNKLQKFAELRDFPNYYQNENPEAPGLTGLGGAPVDLRGCWLSDHFKNSNPLTLELACGRGEYTVALAQRLPNRNFLGVDIKGARIWKGARIALAEGLGQVAFLRTRIEQIDLFFAPEEVSEIWITFPDPFLRQCKANRRLTAPSFLDRYRRFLKSGGTVHLKTDDRQLYDFTLDTIAAYPQAQLLYHDNDIYSKPLPMPELEIKTYYEQMHLHKGKTIKYVRFQLV